MANQHKHKLRGVRNTPDYLWDDLDTGAKSIGEDRSSITRQLWEAWLGYPGAQWPPAPSKGGEREEK
ncbi:hypothetical protein KGD82_13745 [Nocardiopsis eucommiae]|uniref:Uncharacterized protein n=1 Tax=Nocardiopsis eucommiae TaxID=2831970 RepID=A0A975QLZ8_9ACTN|nr:hypothetical protein KGD82_13745 [Nocardiopsis eucommiae]